MFVLPYVAQKPDLGVVDKALKPCDSKPRCVCSFENSDSDHYISPLSYSIPENELREIIKKVLSEQKRFRILAEKDSYFRVEATTLIFRFKDDLELLIDDDNKMLHFRSSSRIGYNDMGTNRRRVENVKSLISDNISQKQ